MGFRRTLAALLAWAWLSPALAASPVGKPVWSPSEIDLPVHQVGPHSYYVEGRLEEATRANGASLQTPAS